MNKKPQYLFDVAKNEKLKMERGFSFEDIIAAIEAGHLLALHTQHHNQEKYSHQHVLVVEMNHYAYLVPCIQEGTTFFLKTAYPSRKATAALLKHSPRRRKT